MHLVGLFLSAFAPSCLLDRDGVDALEIDLDRTSGRAGGRLFGGAPRDHVGS